MIYHWKADMSGFLLVADPNASEQWRKRDAHESSVSTRHNVHTHHRVRRNFRLPLMSINTVQKDPFRCPFKQDRVY